MQPRAARVVRTRLDDMPRGGVPMAPAPWHVVQPRADDARRTGLHTTGGMGDFA